MRSMILRRSFLSSLASGLTLKPQSTRSQSAASSSAQPARHEEDDWLDRLGSKHRMVFDSTTPDGFGAALLFSNNFLDINRSAYGVEYSGSPADKINEELIANIVSNAHMVPAGIVTVNRAQERGYTFAHGV